MYSISKAVHPEVTSGGNSRPSAKICFGEVEPHFTNDIKLHYKRVNLKHELRLLYKWMTCCGIGCPVRLTENTSLLLLQRIYSFLVLLLLWFNFIRTMSGLHNDIRNEVFVAQIVTLSWFLQCAMKATIWFVRDLQPSNTEDFFCHWNQLCQSVQSVQYGLGINQPKLQKSIKLIIGSIIILTMVNTSIIFIARVGPIEETKNETLYYYAPLPEDAQIPLMSLIPFHTLAYFFPVAEFVVIAKVLTRQFINLRLVVIECLKKERWVESCGFLRTQHQNLAIAVYKADQMFCLYLAMEYSTTIAMLTFLLYQLILIHNQFSLFVYAMMTIWTTAVVSMIASVSWFSAVMHEQAHEIVHFIHNAIVPSEPSNKYVLEMDMLLAKLNGPNIAFTVYTLMPITKGFILTVIGVMLTYFALAVQSLPSKSV
ncbi:uncharacterized protein [Antedon mediterranea]|uniref:uncharacterized protein n=1 Tax=Antedon mediterranea TaxID=105859 RepID=UPI003AF48CAB